MSAKSRVLTAHVPIELAEKVDALAAKIDRPRGWIVKQALADWIAVEEYRYQMTLEAMADVRAGRVVDHSVMEAWIAGLERDDPAPP